MIIQNLFDQVVHMDLLLEAYLILIVFDFAAGFLKAFKVEGWKSRKLRDGIMRVLGEIIAIIFAAIIDMILNLNGVGLFSVKSLFIYKECISIAENLGEIGVDLPDVLKNNIEILKNKK